MVVEEEFASRPTWRAGKVCDLCRGRREREREREREWERERERERKRLK